MLMDTYLWGICRKEAKLSVETQDLIPSKFYVVALGEGSVNGAVYGTVHRAYVEHERACIATEEAEKVAKTRKASYRAAKAASCCATCTGATRGQGVLVVASRARDRGNMRQRC